MLKQLLVNEEGKPFLKEYEDVDIVDGSVRIKSLFGAPKHGTELTCYQEDPFASVYYDNDTHIFRKREQVESKVVNMGLGNMWIGEIIEIGNNVEGFYIGQRVAGYGNFKTTHIIKAKDLLIMPDSMTWKEAVCYDPLQFALGAIRDANVRMGDVVLVSGAGAIGLMAAQAAKLAGASFVAVTDPIEKRRRVALENGADVAFDPTSEDFGLLLRDLTNGIGADVVIETSANYKAIEQGIRALAYGGTLVNVGWLKECHVPIHLGREGHFNQQRIVFSRACSDPNNDYPRWDFERICKVAWEMLCKGQYRCENIIAPIVDFERCDQGYIQYVIERPNESVKMGVKFTR